MTVTQCFNKAGMMFYKDNVVQSDVEKLKNELNRVLTNNKYNCVSEIYIQDDPDGDFINLTLYCENESYYECECDYTPGYPAKITGDPYYCYPGASGDIDCYDSIVDVLHEIWDNKDGWTYEVDDEELDSEEYLWELLADN